MTVCIEVYVFSLFSVFFFFNDTATTEIYTLSLHDALPIYLLLGLRRLQPPERRLRLQEAQRLRRLRSEEHTSELQSRPHLVCRLLLEKKKALHYNMLRSMKPNRCSTALLTIMIAAATTSIS